MAQVHLNKHGSGITSKTACGRSAINTPISTNWTEFKNSEHRCEKCDASKVAELNRRNDAKNEEWEPEDVDAWKIADDLLVSRRNIK